MKRLVSTTPWDTLVGDTETVIDGHGCHVARFSHNDDNSSGLPADNAARAVVSVNACKELEHPEQLPMVIAWLRKEAQAPGISTMGTVCKVVLVQLGVTP